MNRLFCLIRRCLLHFRSEPASFPITSIISRVAFHINMLGIIGTIALRDLTAAIALRSLTAIGLGSLTAIGLGSLTAIGLGSLTAISFRSLATLSFRSLATFTGLFKVFNGNWHAPHHAVGFSIIRGCVP